MFLLSHRSLRRRQQPTRDPPAAGAPSKSSADDDDYDTTKKSKVSTLSDENSMTDGLQTNELGVIVSAKVVTAKKRETVYRRKITGIYDSLSHYRSVCVRQIKRYRPRSTQLFLYQVQYVVRTASIIIIINGKYDSPASFSMRRPARSCTRER